MLSLLKLNELETEKDNKTRIFNEEIWQKLSLTEEYITSHLISKNQ